MPQKPSKLPELEKARGTCRSCVYFDPETLTCREDSPKVVSVEDINGIVGPISLWPEADPDEWCGRHKADQ